MSCIISRDFPLLPFEPVPQGPTLAHWRNEIAKLWEDTAGDIEGCVADSVASIPVPDDTRLLALEAFVYNPSGVTPGLYGAANTVGQFTVDTYGRVTLAANVPILIGSAAVTNSHFVTSVTGTAGRVSASVGLTPVIDLVASGVTANTYGSATTVPVFTVDTYGRITAVTNTAIVAAWAGGDVANYVRVTGTGTPVGGSGLELHWDGTSVASIFPYNRATSTYKQLYIDASELFLRITATTRGYLDATHFAVGNAMAIGWAGSVAASGGMDASLWRIAADHIGQYNGTVAQSFSIYGSRTDASNYTRFRITHNGVSQIQFVSEALGTGTAYDFFFSGGQVNTGVFISTVADVTPGVYFRAVSGQGRFWGYVDAARGSLIDATNVAGTVYQRLSLNGSDLKFQTGATDRVFLTGTEAAFYVPISVPAANGALGDSIIFATSGFPTTYLNRIQSSVSGGGLNQLAFIVSDGSAGGSNIVMALDKTGVVCIGTTTVAASMVNGIGMKSGTAPSGNVADCIQFYSSDQAAGNAVPHWRSENGAVYRLFQDTGWTLPTGTASKAGFDTATVTLTQLAQTVKAMMDHLMTGSALFAA